MFKVGEEYRFTLQQMGLKGKNPWVRVAFTAGNDVGKVKTEVTGADGVTYFAVAIAGYDGLFVFRLNEVIGARHAYRATLFLVL